MSVIKILNDGLFPKLKRALEILEPRDLGTHPLNETGFKGMIIVILQDIGCKVTSEKFRKIMDLHTGYIDLFVSFMFGINLIIELKYLSANYFKNIPAKKRHELMDDLQTKELMTQDITINGNISTKFKDFEKAAFKQVEKYQESEDEILLIIGYGRNFWFHYKNKKSEKSGIFRKQDFTEISENFKKLTI